MTHGSRVETVACCVVVIESFINELIRNSKLSALFFTEFNLLNDSFLIVLNKSQWMVDIYRYSSIDTIISSVDELKRNYLRLFHRIQSSE
ncbi:unnamed protein product [Rotaria magnacalcarata]